MTRKTKSKTATAVAKTKCSIKAKTTKTMNTPASKDSKRKATTTHKLVWRHVTCRVRHTPDGLKE